MTTYITKFWDRWTDRWTDKVKSKCYHLGARGAIKVKVIYVCYVCDQAKKDNVKKYNI